jgi:ankyrin repeat protein
MDKNSGHELLNACYFGNDPIALRLIRFGANINYFDPRDGWTPLHYAARWGRVKVLKALCDAGMELNTRTFDKETPLHIACRSNRKDSCIWLMNHQSDPNLLNVNGLRASDLTIEAEIKNVCDHFEDFKKQVIEHRQMLKKQKEKKNKIKGGSQDCLSNLQKENAEEK